MGNEKVAAPGIAQPRRHFARAKAIAIGLYRRASLRRTAARVKRFPIRREGFAIKD
jgi:hypothetical protein